MWGTVLLINSILLSIVSVYFVYSIGGLILAGEWKVFLIAFVLWLFFVLTEISINAIIEQ